MEERFAFGIGDNNALIRRLREKKLSLIDNKKEQLKDSDSELSNPEIFKDFPKVVNFPAPFD